MRLFALVECRDMGLELRMGRGGVAAAIADVWAFTGVSALVVVFGLVGREGLGAAWKAACVGAVAAVAEEVAAELGALLEVFGARVARFPVAVARGAVVDVGRFGVGVECGGVGEGREA